MTVNILGVDDIQNHPLIELAIKLGIPLMGENGKVLDIIVTKTTNVSGGYCEPTSPIHHAIVELWHQINDTPCPCPKCSPNLVKGNDTIQ